jgi:hypothetical protein
MPFRVATGKKSQRVTSCSETPFPSQHRPLPAQTFSDMKTNPVFEQMIPYESKKFPEIHTQKVSGHISPNPLEGWVSTTFE